MTTQSASRKEDVTSPPDEPHEVARSCFDLVDALEGLFIAEKRSGTLDGSVPLRAARGCIPFLAGNEAGFQLRAGERALLRLDGHDGIELHVPKRLMNSIDAGYDDKLEHLLAAGLLRRDGYWHQALSQGAAWRDRDRVCLWTGLLARAAPSTRVLVTGAFNRRVRATVEDCVIADEREFVPVVLDLAVSSFTRGELWLDAELACLLPVWADVEFDDYPIDEDPGVGDQLMRFYSDAYQQKRAKGGAVGDYRRLVAGEMDDRWDHSGRCRLIFAGPDTHTIETFQRFATSAEMSDRDPSGHNLTFAVIRNIASVSARYDPPTVRDVVFDAEDIIAQTRKQWVSLYGENRATHFDTFLAPFAIPIAAPHREPGLRIEPWTFIRTPPGWSSVIDGAHHDAADALRGVISTDVFHHIASPLQFVKPAQLTIATGQPLMRALPVPRALLRAPLRTLTIVEATA